jgi:hypothetical protein
LIGYIVKSHAWKVPILGFMLAGALFVTAGSAQASAPPVSVPQAAQSASAVGAQAPAPTQMTPTQWRALKAGLDSSKDFTHNVNVNAGVRTHAYTYTSGSTVVLQEPVGAVAAFAPFTAMTPLPEPAGCGFLKVCVDLNGAEQASLTAGGTFALGAAICAFPAVGQVSCAVVGTVLAMGAAYIAFNGPCRNKMRLQLFPIRSAGCV